MHFTEYRSGASLDIQDHLSHTDEQDIRSGSQRQTFKLFKFTSTVTLKLIAHAGKLIAHVFTIVSKLNFRLGTSKF